MSSKSRSSKTQNGAKKSSSRGRTAARPKMKGELPPREAAEQEQPVSSSARDRDEDREPSDEE